MKKNVLQKLAGADICAIAGLAVIAWLAGACAAMAQTPPAGMKLYVMDCGTFPARPAPAPMPPSPQFHADPCYLIVHPKGTLLWENGFTDAKNAIPGGRMTRSLKSQLEEIGYPPSKITYIAVSHYHLDHAGNSNDYAGSTWLTQKDQRTMMFGTREEKAKIPGIGNNLEPLPNIDEWSKLEHAKTVIIDNKDYDVFGDGSVTLLFTPVGTPGHQSLLLNLPKTGLIVLTGDLYTEQVFHQMFQQKSGRKTSSGIVYTQAQLDAREGFNPKETPISLKSMEKVEQLLEKTKAQLWIHHDYDHFQTQKKSPQYYE